MRERETVSARLGKVGRGLREVVDCVGVDVQGDRCCDFDDLRVAVAGSAHRGDGCIRNLSARLQQCAGETQVPAAASVWGSILRRRRTLSSSTRAGPVAPRAGNDAAAPECDDLFDATALQVLGDGSYAAVMRVLSSKLGNMSCAEYRKSSLLAG
jgi:hypothetical protein